MAAHETPLSVHLELYRYWSERRQGRAMPQRRDVDPAQIRGLLPALMLVDVVDGRYRFRLVGSAVTRDVGREMTGTFVGTNVAPPAYAAAMCRIYDDICRDQQPLFSTGEYRSPQRASHAISRLLLPLSDDGSTVNMVMLSRVARFGHTLGDSYDWMGGAAGSVAQTLAVRSEAELAGMARAWEAEIARARGADQMVQQLA